MGVVVGSLAIPGSTGNFSVTGLPFQPVAVILWNQYEHLGAHSVTFGAATGSSEEWGLWVGTTTETSGYNLRKREGRSDACAFHRNAVTDAIQWQASFVSMNASGFTLNLDVRNNVSGGDGGNIYYMALGGKHISDAYAGTVSVGGSTGTTAVTAPGFKPTCLVVAHKSGGTFAGGIESHAIFGVGVADATTQFSSFVRINPGSATDMKHIYRTDSVSCFWDGGNRWRIALDSLDPTGFTLDCTEAFAGGTHGYLAIKATGAVAGYGTQPDSTGIVNHSTPRLEPEGVFFCWPGADTPSTSGSSAAPLRPGIGGGTISQQRMSSGIARSSTSFGVWTSDGHQIPTEPLGFWSMGNGIGGSDNLTRASAAIDAMQMGSFDLDWTTVSDTSDRVYGWLALPGEVGGWLPHIYRRRPQ